MAAIVIPFNNNTTNTEPTQIVLGKLKNIQQLEKICSDCDIDTKYYKTHFAYVYALKKYIRTNMNYEWNVDLDDVVIHYNKSL